jgi:HK97 family phage portal protein
MAAEQFAARFFAGDSMPRMALKAPGKISKETNEMLKGSWKQIYGGLSNASDIAILPEGLEPFKIGIDPEAAQMLLTREFQVKEICRVLNIPPHMMGVMEKASYASIEQELLRFSQYSLRPWLVRIEQEMNYKLFAPGERGRFFVEHLVEAMLRADVGARFRAYKDAIYTGIMSPDQAAEKENLPTEGGAAAKKWMPVNYQLIGAAATGAGEPPEPQPVEGV